MIWMKGRQLGCEAFVCRLHRVLTFRFIFPVESIHDIIWVDRNPENQVSIPFVENVNQYIRVPYAFSSNEETMY